MNGRFSPGSPVAIWCITLMCLVAVRISAITHFGIQYAGSDDVLFWTVANDFAHGIFHEPYLYGQNYNPPLESLLAVPLLWSNVPIHVAMPIITSLLAIAPFVSFSYWHMRKREWAAAAAFLFVPLLLPVQWDIITTMTRGFVTGIAVFATLPWALHIDSRHWRTAIVGFILGLSVYLNPNAAIFGLPFAIWFLLRSNSRLKDFLHMAAGGIPTLAMQYYSLHFYAVRPGRIVHRIDDWRMEFHPINLIPEGLNQLGLHFEWLMPLVWGHGSWVLGALALAAHFAARQGNRPAAWAVLSVAPLILLSLAFPKVYDGFSHVLYPYSRMYLAAPLLLAWALASIRWPKPQVCIPILAACCLLAAGVKTTRMQVSVAQAMQPMEGVPVGSWPYQQFKSLVDQVNKVAHWESADLVVFLDGQDGMLHLAMGYGASIVQPNFPPTLFVGFDRRWWRRQAEKQAKHGAILFVGGDEALWNAAHQELPSVVDLSQEHITLHLIRPEGMTTAQVMDRLKRKW